MSGIAEQIGMATRVDAGVPQEWRNRSTWDGEQGEVVTGPTSPTEDFSELLKRFDYDPEKVEIVGKVNQWRKEMPDGKFLVSYFFGVRSRENVLDLPALFAAARKKPRARTKVVPQPHTEVIGLSDLQIGGTGSRGGTPELLERLELVKQKLEARFKRTKPERIVVAEVGDLFEGFESGGNPMFTNDLSLAQQMDLAARVVYDFVELAHKYAPVDVVAVTSNHTQWRRGRNTLGGPADDLGLLVHRNVERVAKAAKLDATWHFPDEFDDSTILDVRGTILGVTHGHLYKGSAAAPLWWAKQQHGGQKIGSADILLAGHLHHLMVLPTGRNPVTGKPKVFLQCPSLDSGASDWFRAMSGDAGDPGLLVFSINDDGFDLQSLAVL